jgi:hypothetical protein
MMAHVPRLPIGLAAFEVMRREGFVYVDKTKDIYRMVDEGMYYFLARPRRFGKSLLVSTLRCLFEGKRALFEGLWIADADWVWEEYPVVLLDFNRITHDTPEAFVAGLESALHSMAARYQITLHESMLKELFGELLLALHRVTGQPVVVLVDEYDKPIIDHLGQGAAAMDIAQANQRIMKQFFGVLKGGDITPILRFVLLTGISRFSKVSIFSELNNLNDLSMHPLYATLLGYTQVELEKYFALHLQRFADMTGLSGEAILERLKTTYDGYRFSKRPVTVYNPFSILKALEIGDFAHYWFETGTPSFLIDLLRERHYPLLQLEGFQAHELLFGTYTIEDLQPEALLFQTGYVTIKDAQGSYYTLGYPNDEVKSAFTTQLLYAFAGPNKQPVSTRVAKLMTLLQQEDFTAFGETIQALFAHIPYPEAAHQDEAHFHALFYLMVAASGMSASPELLTNRGRIDLAVELPDHVFVMEFKCDQSVQAALQQIRAKGYAERYQQSGRRVFLMGFNFSTEERNLVDWKVEGPIDWERVNGPGVIEG